MKLLATLLVLTLTLTRLTAAETVGWRSDGTGNYPQASPPTSWSTEKNVVWKTPLPGQGHGSPILVGDRILVGSAPAELVCLRASDGEVLWQQSGSAADVLGQERAGQLASQYESLAVESKKLHNQAKKTERDSNERQTLQTRLVALKSQMRDLQMKYPVGSARAGNAAATPVSDGRSVFMAFGTGIVCAFSLDGELQWHRFVEGSRLNFGHSSSPALADGRLFVHYNDLIALDCETGEEVWRETLPAKHASPVVAQAGGKSVLITPGGAIVRARDGQRVARSGINLSECSPLLREGTVFAHQKGSIVAFRLPDMAEEDSQVEVAWKTSGSRERRTPSGVLHNGLLYGVSTSGIMEVVDSETGKAEYRKRLNIGKIYSSVTAAGDYVFVTGTGGTTVVIKSGRNYEEIARNELETCGSCPVFAGHRMYVRTQQHLFCIGE